MPDINQTKEKPVLKAPEAAKIEGLPTPEELEKKAEIPRPKEMVAEVAPPKEEAPPRAPAAAAPPAPPAPRDEILSRVEKILEEDLEQTYLTMPPHLQRAFKQKGEETAIEIRGLIHAAKVKVKKIVKLIVEWLRMIPNVNKFFLEQEAKIKTDRILAMAAREKEKGEL